MSHPAALVFACVEDGRGRMWLGTDAGLVALDLDTERSVAVPPLPPALAHETVYALWVDG